MTEQNATVKKNVAKGKSGSYLKHSNPLKKPTENSSPCWKTPTQNLLQKS